MSIDNTREVTGYVSRWMLLVLCVIIVIWSIYTATVATSYLDENLSSNVVVPDELWNESAKYPYVNALPANSFPGGRPPFAYSVDPTGKIRQAQTNQYHRWLGCIANNLPSGVNEISVRGIPYSSLGFFQQQTKLYLIPNHVEVYLLDARIAIELQKTNKPLLDKIIKNISRLGLCAIVCVESPMRYVQIREELSDYSDLPMLCSTEKGRYDLMTTIWRTRRRLLRPQNRQPFVITTDGKLADWAGAQRHYVHLVGADDLEKARFNIRRHKSFEDFEKYVSGEFTPYGERKN